MQMTKTYFVNIITCFSNVFASAQKNTNAELCVLLSKRRMAYLEIFKFILYPCGIEISQSFTWQLGVR